MFSILKAQKNKYFLKKTKVFQPQGFEKHIFPEENQCFPASRNFKQPHMLDCRILLSLRGARRNRNLEIRRGTIFEISLFEPLHVFVRSSFLCILAFSSTGYPMGSQTGYHIQIQIHLWVMPKSQGPNFSKYVPPRISLADDMSKTYARLLPRVDAIFLFVNFGQPRLSFSWPRG